MKQLPVWNLFPGASSCSSRGLWYPSFWKMLDPEQERFDSLPGKVVLNSVNGPQWSRALQDFIVSVLHDTDCSCGVAGTSKLGSCSTALFWRQTVLSTLQRRLKLGGCRIVRLRRWPRLGVGIAVSLSTGHQVASSWASSGLLAICDRLCSSPRVVFANKFC